MVLKTTMSIEEKVKAVKKIYRLLDADVQRFKKESGLKCLRFCSHCCEKNDITATVLEFLPLAYSLYKENQCENYLEKLKEMEAADNNKCILLIYPSKKEHAGRCLAYKMRPLVCRLFGFSTVLDKNSRPQLVTCREIKQTYNENYLRAVNILETAEPGVPVDIPIMKNYCMMLYGIDLSLAQKYYPLDTALRMAIESVLSAFAYR
jgi:Fe-S-cluster containining protein